MTAKIVKPFKHIKTYKLEFTIDRECMELHGFKFSPRFEREIDDLARCDLIADLVYLLQQDKTRSFKRYYDATKPQGK